MAEGDPDGVPTGVEVRVRRGVRVLVRVGKGVRVRETVDAGVCDGVTPGVDVCVLVLVAVRGGVLVTLLVGVEDRVARRVPLGEAARVSDGEKEVEREGVLLGDAALLPDRLGVAVLKTLRIN